MIWEYMFQAAAVLLKSNHISCENSAVLTDSVSNLKGQFNGFVRQVEKESQFSFALRPTFWIRQYEIQWQCQKRWSHVCLLNVGTSFLRPR